MARGAHQAGFRIVQLQMLLSKPQILDKLRDLVAARSGTIHSIGGDCYALCVNQDVRVAVALKETVKQDKAIWIGVPSPVLDLVTGGRSVQSFPVPHPYRGWILISHVRYKTLLAIPLVPIAQDLSRRATADRHEIRDEFDVKMTGYKKYVIRGEKYGGDIPITNVDTLLPIEMLLDLPRSVFEEHGA